MDPQSAYREGAVRGATGVRLVISLYEQAIRDLRRAAMAMEQGEVELRTKQINHAVSVVGHLQGTLDRERGGEVSRNLERFYNNIRSRLLEAQVHVSPEILHQQISDLLSVREAWVEVDRATGASSRNQARTSGGDRESFTRTATLSADRKY